MQDSIVAGVDVVPFGGRQHRSAAVAERRGPAGVEEQGAYITGSSRNLGASVVSVDETGLGTPVNTPGLLVLRLAPAGAKPKAQRRYREAKETKRRGKGGRKSECLIVPMKRGNRPEGPRGGKGAPEHGHVRGKDGGDIGLHNRINETRADSEAGARDAAGGIDDACSAHRYRLAARGVSAHAQGRSHRRGPTDGPRLCEQPGGKPPLAARTGQVRQLRGTTGSESAHTKRRWLADASHRDTYLRGQGASTGGSHGTGGSLRAELSGLLVRLPAWSFGASGASSSVGPDDDDGGQVGPGA